MIARRHVCRDSWRPRRVHLLRVAGALSILATVAGRPAPEPYELVLAGGRVIDPESGLDAVRNVGIRDGRIAAITARTLDGRERIDVGGLVVVPGFIDLHVHAHDPASYRLLPRDGVTTAAELERGVWRVARWCAEREARTLLHHAVASGHQRARIALLHGEAAVSDPVVLQSADAAWVRRTLAGAELDRLAALVERGLRDGAPGIGVIIQQTPGASREQARRRGIDITSEAYPYTAATQRLSSAMLDSGWQERLGIRHRDMLWPPTGERLTEKTFLDTARVIDRATYERPDQPSAGIVHIDSTCAASWSRAISSAAASPTPRRSRGRPRPGAAS